MQCFKHKQRFCTKWSFFIPSRIRDRLCINRPFTAKFNFWVQPKIAAMNAQDRYSVIGMGVIYGVLAILCRGMKRRLRIVSPGATLLLPFTDKECRDINGDLVNDHNPLSRTLDFPRHSELLPR